MNGALAGTLNIWVSVVALALILAVAVAIAIARIKEMRRIKELERGLKMIAMQIHLPPSTDDIQGGGRDERDVANEAISQAEVMYSIVASTLNTEKSAKMYGQRHLSFEIVANDGLVKYFAVVPAVLTETVKQAILSAYPAARVTESERENIFSKKAKLEGVAGGELVLAKDFVYPIATYEDTKRDASLGILNAMSMAKPGDGLGVQVIIRPKNDEWMKQSEEWIENMKEGKENKGFARKKSKKTDLVSKIGNSVVQIIKALWEPPETKEDEEKENKGLSSIEQAEVAAIEQKTKHAGFETLIRIVASSDEGKMRAEALVGGVVTAFAQFNSPMHNGFKFDRAKDSKKIAQDYILRSFPLKRCSDILNGVELASIYHLPEQSAIPSSQVIRQLTRQVEGPARLVEDGVLIGINEFRGEKKEIRLSVDDRRRHVYVIGSTGMGKSVFMRNIAYQDMLEGRGFAFIDPHGDVVEELLSMVPEERIDDVIYFDPGDTEHPIGMNMFEFQTEEQKDFIVQEGINMLQSLYDPENKGFFGPRGQHMFRNAALLLMSDPNGATFVDIPRCFIDPDFVREKLKYVKDRQIFDYWTKEFPASQRSNDAGEVITWFASKWGPFISNQMMKNVLGQLKSGFDIRDIMDHKKILLVNLSKGRMGELNSKLLGMIFVMKFQAAAMSRANVPEQEREDFCLFVDEFQNFSTESFESILSEARKFRLNLIVANQFMTQLTDKIREGVLGNVGTIIAGRLGVTDAELIEKVFSPTFTAEDLHKTENHNAIATVMMFGMPSTPFTMTWPKLGTENVEVRERLRTYSATKYARPRQEVSAEIDRRLAATKKPAASSGSGAGAWRRPGASGVDKGGDSLDEKMARIEELLRKRREERKRKEAELAGTKPAEIKPAGADLAKIKSTKANSTEAEKQNGVEDPGGKREENFLEAWLRKKAELEKKQRA